MIKKNDVCFSNGDFCSQIKSPNIAVRVVSRHNPEWAPVSSECSMSSEFPGSTSAGSADEAAAKNPAFASALERARQVGG